MSADPFGHHRLVATPDYVSLVRAAQAGRVAEVAEFLSRHGEQLIALAGIAAHREAASDAVAARRSAARLSRLLSEAEDEHNKIRRQLEQEKRNGVRQARKDATKVATQSAGRQVRTLRLRIVHMQAKIANLRSQVSNLQLQVKRAINMKLAVFKPSPARKRRQSSRERAAQLLGGVR